MVQYPLKAIHNVTRPGEEPRTGDVVEVECVGGFVREVDPITRKCRETRKQFVFGEK